MKKTQKNPPNIVSWDYGYVIHGSFPDTITGKTLTLIEAMGLPEKQEESVKSLIRQAIWNEITENAITISPERHTEIRKLYYQKKSEAFSKGTPIPFI